MDGAYVDNLATAQTVGLMQRRVLAKAKAKAARASASSQPPLRLSPPPLRLVLVDASTAAGEYGDTEMLFANSPSTKGIAPGEATTAMAGITAPSCQAFDTDWNVVAALYRRVGPASLSGNITFAEVATTTVANPAFGIAAGTPVELLIFQTNSPLPMWLPYQDGGNLAASEIRKYQQLAAFSSSVPVQRIVKEWMRRTEYPSTATPAESRSE
jgi:hypothetical protein